ncbi:hypothetical protein [Dyella mobilis]|uniref:Type 1 fimbrial protein n=1 Tax=Dyella mobilis TaxID=1849582 RepID=A0ABS2KBR9_9GAMM|nr:hypothetical protein [Dyella mobilis]MBM7128604.1 hypothetical protein [Dyella mobilis]GLQ99492.1 hypothetical protein GCM10007863_39120 [Dyella mobilis]
MQAGGGGSIEGGGTISFIGAVVAPTCSVATDQQSLSALIGTSGLHPSQSFNCSNPAAGAEASTADPSRIYAVDVDHLTRSEPDQVLNYFASYVRAAQTGPADPVLVTQSFE